MSHSEDVVGIADPSEDGMLQNGDVKHILPASPCTTGPHLTSQR